jgi:hypothetical protein
LASSKPHGSSARDERKNECHADGQNDEWSLAIKELIAKRCDSMNCWQLDKVLIAIDELFANWENE